MAVKLNKDLIESISEMYQMGYPAKTIAESLDINIRTVFFYVKELGVANRRNTIDSCKDGVISDYLKGDKLKDISNKFNISVSAICKMLRKENIRREERKIDDERIVNNYMSGMSAKSSGEECGMSESYVLNLLKKRGIERRNYSDCQPNKIERNKILEMRNAGISNKEIAKELGCSLTTITNCANDIGIANNAKTDEEIIEAFNSTSSMKEAADKLGVHESTIQKRAKELGLDTSKNKRRRELHYRWLGGTTPEIEAIRKSTPYLKWRKEVYRRDGYRCRHPNCDNSNKTIHAHHIVPVVKNKDMAFDINNGITLCVKCHYSTYGKELEYVKIFREIIED